MENIEKLVKGLQKSEVNIFKIKYSEWEKIQMSTGLKFEAIDLKLKQETKIMHFNGMTVQKKNKRIGICLTLESYSKFPNIQNLRFMIQPIIIIF